MAKAKPKTEEAPRETYIQSKRVKYADSCNNDRWSVVLETHHTRADIMTPRFWTSISNKFKPGDILDIRYDNESVYAEFIVIEADRLGARLQELRWVELGGTGSDVAIDTSDYKYEWKGPHMKHCVVRSDDGEIIMKEFPSRDAALLWIAGRNQAA